MRVPVLVQKFRLLIASISILLLTLLLLNPNDQYFYVRVDYVVWLSSILMVLALLLDYLRFYRSYSYASTLTFDLVALIMVVIGRIGSLFYSLAVQYFVAPIIGGGIADATALRIAIWAVIGSIEGFLTIAIHTILKKPIVLAPAPTFGEIQDRVLHVFKRVEELIINHYMFAVFITGFAVRFVPEIRAWPYPIGWDTIEYIAYLRDFITRFNPFGEYIWLGDYRHIPPLMSMILSIPSIFVDPWYLLKLWEPIIFGFIAALSAYIANKMLGAKPGIALIAGIVTVLHVITLGSSQQWHRHMLGALTILLFIATTVSRGSRYQRVLSLMLMAMAYELTAVLALLLSIYEAIKAREVRERLLCTAVALLSLTLLVWYMKTPLGPHPITGVTVTGISTAQFVYEAQDLVAWTILFLIPSIPAIVVANRMSSEYRVILAILLLAVLAPAISPYTALDLQYRWSSLLVVLLIPPTIVGYARLERKVLALYITIIVFLGMIYVAIPSEKLYLKPLRVVWRSHLQGFPWSLTPVPESSTNFDSRINVSVWLSKNSNPNIPILTSLSAYPFLHLYIRNPINIHIGSEQPDIRYVLEYINKTNVNVIYVVTVYNLTEQVKDLENSGIVKACTLKVQPIIEGEYNLYVVRRDVCENRV